MARNENLEARVREALAEVSKVEEKQMFRGMAFLVNDKLCISAGDNELMFRIDPALHDSYVEKHGCREMLRNGKAIKRYVYVHEDMVKTKKDLDYWIKLALNYNKKVKPAKKKAKP